MSMQKPNIRTGAIPRYDRLRNFLTLIGGQDFAVYQSMTDAISSYKGTPQNTTDWSDQTIWIPQLLTGKEHELAEYLFKESNGNLYLRYLSRIERVINVHNLVLVNESGKFVVADAGQDFVNNPFGDTEQSIDYLEGSLHLLLIIAENGPGKRGDFMPDFIAMLKLYSNYRSTSVFNHCWMHRVRNFQFREFVESSGITYEITEKGLWYLETASTLLQQSGRNSVTQEQTDIRRLIKQQNIEVRESLAQYLSEMNPYKFEHLVKDLLVAIGYDNAEVTSQSGDGGVDVIADIEVGITPVREVVQVKRHKRNIQRSTLDQLRGSLHRFDATRGMIITTGGFSSGAKDAAFEYGVAPITLIDGEHLIELLIEHEIGVRKRSIQLIEFESADFEEKDE